MQVKIKYIFQFLISKSNCLSIVIKSEILLNNLTVIYYMLIYNNFFYTQLAFVFDLQKDLYIAHDNIDTFFFFFFRKTLISFTCYFSFFVFYFLRKILITFTCFFSKSFFVFFIIFSCNFYIWKKTYKKYFISFFICSSIWVMLFNYVICNYVI